MRGNHLGEFEELVLLAVASLQGEAYGNAIQQVLAEEAQRQVKLSTVHVALQRLEEKGLLRSAFGEATPERGGRRKRYFEVTAAGIASLKATQAIREHMWNLIPNQL